MMIFGFIIALGLFAATATVLWGRTLRQAQKLLQASGKLEQTSRLLETCNEEKAALSNELTARTQSLSQQASLLQEALDRLGRTQEELVKTEKLAAMGRLAAGIAHEINNPMNAVINTLAPLGETIASLASSVDSAAVTAGTDAADMLNVVRRGALRAHAIVQSLNAYSRGDNETMREVNVLRAIDDALDLLAPQMSNIEVHKDIQTGIRISGFAGQIDNVLVNLLTNAVQAIGPAPGRITIEMHSLQRGQEVMLLVSDTGNGISPELVPRIFDPFFTTRGVGQGAGLGLCIVHGIVERHGGRIEVDSVVGQGTTFRVFLPVFAGFIAATQPVAV